MLLQLTYCNSEMIIIFYLHSRNSEHDERTALYQQLKEADGSEWAYLITIFVASIGNIYC